MNSLRLDLRFALRTMRRAPLVYGLAILCTGLGIGAVTTIYSFATAFTFRPLPQLARASRLVHVAESPVSDPTFYDQMSPGAFLDLRSLRDVFSDVTAWRWSDANIVGPDAAELVRAALVPANFFRAMGRRPVAGRDFTEGDEDPGGERVAVMGHGLWQRRFGSDPSLVGGTVRLNGVPVVVVGIMPEGFTFPGVHVWMPLGLGAEAASVRGQRNLTVIARLAPGVSLRRAAAAVETLGGRVAAAHPEASAGWVLHAQPAERYYGRGPRPFMLALLGTVAFVLLIACANVANLLLARATARRREVGVRVALGASRGRILRQLLTESVLIALLGGALGVLFAWWGLDAMATAVPSELHLVIPGMDAIRIDGRALAFTTIVSVASGLLFGLAPALAASRSDVIQSLKDAGRASAGSRIRLLRDGLVVAEVALALMLLVGASLMIASARRLLLTDPGFRTSGVLTLAVTLPAADYPDNLAVTTFFDRLLEQVSALSGVDGAGLTTVLPMDWSDHRAGVEVEGRPLRRPEDAPNLGWRVVSPDYLGTLGVRLVAGRAFTEYDDQAAPGVALVSEAAARRLWPGESPVGRRLRIRGRWVEVVGLVGNVRGNVLTSDDPLPVLYVPRRQWPARTMFVVARTSGDPARLAPAIQSQISRLDGQLAAGDIAPMSRVVATAVSPQTATARTMSGAALIALIMAAVGTYGVLAYGVAQRTHEIGVRVALGATNRDVLGLVIGRAASLATAGILLGVVGVVAMGFGLRAILYETSATDPRVITGVAAILGVVALLAGYVPARRAARTDPMTALRSE